MKTYILHVNLDIKNLETATDTIRFEKAMETIEHFASPSRKVVIISHRGRPKNQEKGLSLQPFRKLIQDRTGKSVGFLPFGDLRSIATIVEKSKRGSILLLENLRFFDGEEAVSLPLAKKLAKLGDVYIYDDFATSHHKQASSVGIPRYIPSEMGPLCKKEVKTLSGIVKRSAAPFVLIIGGSKISDKLDVIKNLLPKVDHILLGGGAALTFQKAQGMDIKDSISEDSMIPHIKDLLADNKIVLPIDELWEQDRILDIGPATVSHYEAIIKTAKTIVWAGPMGLYENSQFANGSKKIAKAIAASNAFSVIGGGDTTKILTNMDIEKEISFVSTGGGAMLELLAGKELPAIQALIDQKK